MIEINLLPKELQRRTGRIALPKGATYLLAGIAGLAAVLAGLTVMQKMRIANIQKKIAEARAREAKMQKDIQLVDALTALKGKILERMEAIEGLDRNRSAYVRFLEDLSGRVPEYLWLSNFREGTSGAAAAASAPPRGGTTAGGPAQPAASSGAKTVIEGFSYSLNSLATFMIQMKKSPFIQNIELSFAKEQKMENSRLYNFQLTCDLTMVPEEAPTETEGQKPIRLGDAQQP
ncbi:MAG: PilN domain-containing protein [candidate division Zixibacteria bacterium]|nr:PilN domain-containing protein [candidate division Zixibacteria bacterium]